jgi:hypothetical protein
MKTLCVLSLALAILPVSAEEATKARDRPPDPPYYADRACDREMPAALRREDRDKTLVLEAASVPKAFAAAGVQVIVPTFALERDFRFQPDRCRIRDLLDTVAEYSLGEWQKVSGAYVLVLPPDLLELAHLGSGGRNEYAKNLLNELIRSMTARQMAQVRAGIPLSQSACSPAQSRSLALTGLLQFFNTPEWVDPKAIRGEGVRLLYRIPPTGKPILELSLPHRNGKTLPWLRVPFPTAGPGNTSRNR